MTGVVEHQIQELKDRFPAAGAHGLPSGAWLVTVDGVALPVGWSKPQTAIRFLIPVGYPFAKMDCFWADDDLRLADGRVPQNAVPNNSIPEAGGLGLWFSWHLTGPWNANRDTLSTWMNSINDRLRRLQ